MASSTNPHSQLPGLRQSGESTISIISAGVQGLATMAILEPFLGPLAHQSGGEMVWVAENLEGGATARHFSGPTALMARLSHNAALIGDGIAAKLSRADLADCQVSGTGAALMMVSRTMPGMRQSASAFPPIPDSWAAAISVALQSGRFLKPGAGLPSAATIPVAKAPPPNVAAPPPPMPASAKPSGPDAGELARQSGILSKFKFAAPATRARVSALLAQGKI